MTHRPPFGRIAGFALAPAVSAVSPIIVLPVIAHALGADGWSAMAIGQSIGLTGAIVVSWGWNVVGPTEIARASNENRYSVYAQSLLLRSLLAVVVCVAAALIVPFVYDGRYLPAATLMAVSMSLAGLSPSWFYMGVGEPLRIVLYDAMPKVLAAVVAVPFVILFSSSVAYPLLFGCFVLWSVAWSWKEVRGRFSGEQPTVVSALKTLRHSSAVAGSQVMASVYTSLSVTLFSVGASITLLAPAATVAVATFAAGFRLVRLVQAGLSAVIRALQGWVAERWDLSGMEAVRTALATVLSCSALLSLMIGICLPWLSSVLFGPAVELGYDSSWTLAAAFFSYSVTASFALFLLIPGNEVRVMAHATAAAAVVGGVSVVVLSAILGVLGGALGVLSAELTVLVIQSPAALRVFRRLAADRPAQE